MYEELKFLHVLAVIFLGGTVLVDALGGILMPRCNTVAELRAMTRLSRVNQFLGIAAAVLVPVFGYLTANDGSWALDTGWLVVGQVLFWLSVVIGLGYLMPGALRLRSKVADLPDGPIPEEVRAQMENPVFPLLGILLTIFFVTIVYMMVVKPNL
jgi:uncharacterized membrane protein